MRTVTVVPHNPEWRAEYDAESHRILQALGPESITIHHIGSTSVSGIYAKPIVDMLGIVEDLASLDTRANEMEQLGYEVMGEFGIPGRRYFRLNDEEGIRRFQLHVFVTGSDDVTRHLAFRDFLNAHPTVAREYSELKRQLAKRHSASITDYMDGKDGFIKDTQMKALRWYGAN
ncbi:MAG: GrpB family protein [Pseudomonadales bacterium]|nr:GrpB family protein [Pseudomonadales bacterium]